MDAIILAAGENVRLQVTGLAPGRKPLIIRDGEVLIRRLCRQVRENPCDRLIIVASPRNVEDIVFATHDFNPMYIVQPHATSPQAAFRLGLELTRCDDVMLLMGDNFIQNWYVNHAHHPTVEAVLSNDHALHPISGDGFFTRDQDTLIRWLGPLTVNVPMLDVDTGWADWVHTFENIEFEVLTHPGNVEDMGTIASAKVLDK